METSDRLQAAIARLTAAGVETPRLEAQLLLAQALGTTRTAIVAGIYREPDADQRAEFERLVQARELRTPLAYLRGTQEFFGLTFRVGPEVLIPRPETEMLVEFALEKLGAAGTLADVGTGSGCILTAALANAVRARGVGFDLSAAALALAQHNIRQNGAAERARLAQGDLLTGAGAERFEVIVSNPPYIPSAEIAGLAPEVRDAEPRLALDGGPDGLECYRRLAVQALKALRPGGWLAVEVGRGQAPDVATLWLAAGWQEVNARRDLAGIERVVCGRKEVR
ncbi:MAG: [protein release factor]-glutamine N5-methyltransferase [Chthonomonadaceae bacterium]|nr:[protein release factor]-glutamine N5-methyltransferase [Chthonomonadaceae bacterium]